MKHFAYAALQRRAIAGRTLRRRQLDASDMSPLSQALQHAEERGNRHVVPQQVPRHRARSHDVHHARGDGLPARVRAEGGEECGVGAEGLELLVERVERAGERALADQGRSGIALAPSAEPSVVELAVKVCCEAEVLEAHVEVAGGGGVHGAVPI